MRAKCVSCVLFICLARNGFWVWQIDTRRNIVFFRVDTKAEQPGTENSRAANLSVSTFSGYLVHIAKKPFRANDIATLDV